MEAEAADAIGTIPQGSGFGAAYGLGAFSGVASACCAPVLAGVAVLSGATASFPAALGVGLVYVLGMVALLVVIALAWERGHHGPARILQGRRVQMRAGTWQRSLPLGDLLAGILLVAMGLLTAVLALTGPSMPNSGWRVTFTADLQHLASLATRALAWLPGWAVAGVVVAVLILLLRRARRPRSAPAEHAGSDSAVATPVPADRTTTMEGPTDGR